MPTDDAAVPVGIDLLVVPYDDGRRAERMGAGPVSFIDAGLPGFLSRLGHDVTVTWIETRRVEPLAAAVDLARTIATHARTSRSHDRFPLTLAGGCMATVGAVAGCGTADSAIVWMDAHADLNTPATSPSGFLDGMAAATLLGWCHARAFEPVGGWCPRPASRLLLVGARALDAPEVEAAREHGVRIVAPADLDDGDALGRTLAAFAPDAPDVYLHIDLDVLDPADVAHANAFACPDGVAFVAAVRLVQAVAARWPVRGLTLASYDPAVDVQGLVRAAARPLILEALRR